jgi:hypothetical protein
MTSSDHYGQELITQLQRATMRGMKHILVNARKTLPSMLIFRANFYNLTREATSR